MATRRRPDNVISSLRAVRHASGLNTCTAGSFSPRYMSAFDASEYEGESEQPYEHESNQVELTVIDSIKAIAS